MKKTDTVIPLYEIAFLQAYLYELFSLEGHCRKNFDHTVWHLKQKYSDEEVESVVDFFRNHGLKCDCDLLHHFDLREFSERKIKFHKRK